MKSNGLKYFILWGGGVSVLTGFFFYTLNTDFNASTMDTLVGSRVKALPETKDHTCRVWQNRRGIRWHYPCSLYHSLLIPNLGLDYTTVIYTSMRSKGNAAAIRLHFCPTLDPVNIEMQCPNWRFSIIFVYHSIARTVLIPYTNSQSILVLIEGQFLLYVWMCSR